MLHSKRKNAGRAAVAAAVVFAILTGGAGTVFKATAAELDVFYDSADLIAQPTVVTEVTGADSLASLSAEQTPASVIVTLNASLAVLDGSGSSLGSFDEIYTDYIEGKFIPVIRPADSAALDAFIAYRAENHIAELAVVSDKPVILNSARENMSAAYLYYEATDVYSEADCMTQIGIANVCGAQALILDEANLQAEYVRFIQARFKCVWAATDGSETQIADAVGQGVYGIVSPTAAPVFSVFGKISSAADVYDGAAKLAVLARAPYTAAHRGNVTLYFENTLEAIRSAANLGATHSEIDIRLTADKEVVLWHDADITRLRNADGSAASGTAENKTLAELKALDTPDGLKIATLDELFAAVRDGETGDMVLVVEIKGQEPELVSLFAQKVSEYGVSDRIAIISFYPAQLLRTAQQLPSIPSSLLLYTKSGDEVLAAVHSGRTGIDMQYSGDSGLKGYYGGGSTTAAYANAFRTFADRGYSMWFWTYDTEKMSEGIRNGVTGITTDDAITANGMAEILLTEETYEVSSLPEEYSDFTVKARTYAGDTVELPATVVYLDKGEKEATAVLVAKTIYSTALVSETVTFKVGGASSGCGSAALPAAGAGGLVAVAAAIVKRRK